MSLFLQRGIGQSHRAPVAQELGVQEVTPARSAAWPLVVSPPKMGIQDHLINQVV